MPLHIVQESRWAPGLVWRDAENLTSTRIRYQDCPARGKSLCKLLDPVLFTTALEGHFLNLVHFWTKSCSFTEIVNCKRTRNGAAIDWYAVYILLAKVDSTVLI